LKNNKRKPKKQKKMCKSTRIDKAYENIGIENNINTKKAALKKVKLDKKRNTKGKGQQQRK
jgi:hypothetical protein